MARESDKAFVAAAQIFLYGAFSRHDIREIVVFVGFSVYPLNLVQGYGCLQHCFKINTPVCRFRSASACQSMSERRLHMHKKATCLFSSGCQIPAYTTHRYIDIRIKQSVFREGEKRQLHQQRLRSRIESRPGTTYKRFTAVLRKTVYHITAFSYESRCIAKHNKPEIIVIGISGFYLVGEVFFVDHKQHVEAVEFQRPFKSQPGLA